MYLFLEKAKRGGFSSVFYKHLQANNEYLPDYDKDKAKSYIMYYDMNNLYGYAMSQKLPLNNFKWLTRT